MIKGLLAVITVLASFAMLGLLMFYPIPQENKDLVNIAIGMLVGTGFGSIITFYFGSSEGSVKKNEIIEKFTLGDEKGE